VKFSPTELPGVVIVDLDRLEDERGFFARSWCAGEFAEHGLSPLLSQCNVSFNTRRGTLRGMHFQREPWSEAKLVRCTRGRIYDVALDLRRDSPSFRRWVSIELSEENRRMLYIPEGCAHGFQTLEDASEVFYQMTNRYNAESAAGVRWNDPAFGIEWPLPDPILSPRDAGYPDFT